MHTEVKDQIRKFLKFVDVEISAAIIELNRITVENNRKHLQRLVYVNLINRFDLALDNLLLQYSLVEGNFKKKVLDETKEDTVFLKDIYEILLSNDPKIAVQKRIQSVTRARFLTLRHSEKLRILLKHCLNWKDTDLQRPRVFTNNGKIFNDVTRLNPYRVPDNVIGYADWLYSRRNALVHGSGTKLNDHDLEVMKRKFDPVNPASSIKIPVSSIKSASVFYSDLFKLLLDSN